MRRYRLTPVARLGLLDIVDHVEARFGLDVAEKVVDRLEGAFQLLAENPGVGIGAKTSRPFQMSDSGR